MSSFDITFCSNPKCKNPSLCRRDPARLKKYPYPVSMMDFPGPDEDGECLDYYPWSVEEIDKNDPDYRFIEFLLARIREGK